MRESSRVRCAPLPGRGTAAFRPTRRWNEPRSSNRPAYIAGVAVGVGETVGVGLLVGVEVGAVEDR